MDKCDEHIAHHRALDIHDKRLDNHGMQLDKLNETLAALKEIERQNQERIDALDKRMTELESVPARRWDTVVNYVLTAALGIVAGIIAAHFGI